MTRYKKYKVSKSKTKKYKKNPRAPKALIGEIFQGVQGIGSMIHGFGALRKANRAIKDFDKSRMITKKSTELQKLKDEPISQKLIEAQQDAQKVSEATATGALQKTGARGLQAGIQNILKSGASRDLDLMGKQETARQNVLGKVITEEQKILGEKSGMAREEMKSLQAQRASGIENIFGGFENVGAAAGGAESDLLTLVGGGMAKGDIVPKYKKREIFPGRKGIFPKKGTAIKSPGKFSHKENPMDIVKDDKKIGEFTGNETIIAPKDTKAIVELLQQEDEKNLFDKMRELFTRFLKK